MPTFPKNSLTKQNGSPGDKIVAFFLSFATIIHKAIIPKSGLPGFQYYRFNHTDIAENKVLGKMPSSRNFVL